MRIIAGTHKNRRIDFKNLNIRPTTNFAKESLFNILDNQYDLQSTSILDLFAGSGNISYEFISRGCKDVLAVDNNIKCVKFIDATNSKACAAINKNVAVTKEKIVKVKNSILDKSKIEDLAKKSGIVRR